MQRLALVAGTRLLAGLCGRTNRATHSSLVIGHPSVNGKIYKEHYASVKMSYVSSVLQRSLSFLSHTYVTHSDGVEARIVDGHPTAATHDTAFFLETVLDRRDDGALA